MSGAVQFFNQLQEDDESVMRTFEEGDEVAAEEKAPVEEHKA